MHRAHTFALAEDLTMTVLRMFLPQRKVHLGPVCLRQKGTAGASLVAREVWGLREAAYLLLLELHPRNSAGLRPGFGKREHNQLRVALAESFLCSAEAAVHVLYSLFTEFTQFNNLWLSLLFHFGNPSTKVNI